MKILLACLNFKSLTGSELYFYDLAIALRLLGHDVSILANMKDGALHVDAEKRHKIKPYDLSLAPPPNSKFDVILASHRPIIESLIKQKMYGDTPIISINHSEVIPLEFPVIDDATNRICHYIAIRDSIKTFLCQKYFIEDSDVSVIYNPINTDRLLSRKPRPLKRKTVLFPATIDYLRIKTIEHLIAKSEEEDFDVVFVGNKNIDYTPTGKNVTYYPATWHIQGYYSRATHTASILMGRTVIEGWFYGLPSYIYDIDKQGAIKGMELVEPPSREELFKKYNYKNVAHQILDLVKTQLAKKHLAI